MGRHGGRTLTGPLLLVFVERGLGDVPDVAVLLLLVLGRGLDVHEEQVRLAVHFDGLDAGLPLREVDAARVDDVHDAVLLTDLDAFALIDVQLDGPHVLLLVVAPLDAVALEEFGFVGAEADGLLVQAGAALGEDAALGRTAPTADRSHLVAFDLNDIEVVVFGSGLVLGFGFGHGIHQDHYTTLYNINLMPESLKHPDTRPMQDIIQRIIQLHWDTILFRSAMERVSPY